VGGGVAIKNQMDKTAQAEQRAKDIQAEKDKLEDQERSLQFQLQNTQDPQKIAELEAQLAAAKDKANNLAVQQGNAGVGGSAPHPVQHVNSAPPPPKPKAACNCTPGDPLCSCL
jgi:hypothetical protein